MKKVILNFCLITLASIVCGQQKSDEKIVKTSSSQQNSNSTGTTKELDPNFSPESVMNTIFQSAKTGEVVILKSLLPPYNEQTGRIPCDRDCKALCNPGNESMKDELRGNYISFEVFKESFSKAKIIGTPLINGDEAKVNFVFGPNMERNETMNLQRINGKWYLSSF